MGTGASLPIPSHPRGLCHACSKTFPLIATEPLCPYCSSDFIEELETEGQGGGMLVASDVLAGAIQTDGGLTVAELVFSVIHERHRELMELQGRYAGMGLLPMGNSDELQEAMTRSMNETDGRPPPASQKEVANLPIITIGAKNQHKQKDCAICEDDFKMGDQGMVLPCDHMFHPTCIRPWLEKTNSCPICRLQLMTDDPEYEKIRKDKENPNPVNNTRLPASTASAASSSSSAAAMISRFDRAHYSDSDSDSSSSEESIALRPAMRSNSSLHSSYNYMNRNRNNNTAAAAAATTTTTTTTTRPNVTTTTATRVIGLSTAARPAVASRPPVRTTVAASATSKSPTKK